MKGSIELAYCTNLTTVSVTCAAAVRIGDIQGLHSRRQELHWGGSRVTWRYDGQIACAGGAAAQP